MWCNGLPKEIAAARQENPGLRLVVGHGGGSFGHVAAAKFGTRQGVEIGGAVAGFCRSSRGDGAPEPAGDGGAVGGGCARFELAAIRQCFV